MSNILKKAIDIIDHSGDKEKKYGPFIECMDKTAEIASVMSGKEITTRDAYNVLIAVKLARQSYTHQEDNLLDAVAYIASLNNLNNQENNSNK